MKFLSNILKSIKGLIITFILLIVTIFMINNRQIISIEFKPLPIESFETRLFVLMLIFYFLGLVTAVLIYSNTMIKNFFRNIKQKRQIKLLKKQIDAK